MNILAIDTASEYLSLAISKNGQIFSSLVIVNNQQSNYIINKIQNLLNNANLTINEINLVAYNQGPGSFTGLRIGLSVALGIAIGLQIDLMPIPAFAILAKSSNLTGKLLVGIDARLKQLYIAGLDSNSLDYIVEPSLINLDQLSALTDYTFCGYNLEQYIPELSFNTQVMPLINLAYPNASHIIELVNTNKYPTVTASEAQLFYIRNKIALNLEEQNAAKSKY